MWRSGGDDTVVTCIACGTDLPRSDAREYDKAGDRWDRHDKEFEYLCKECHGELCHQPRDGLEETLVTLAGDIDGDAADFAAAYQRHARDADDER